MELEIYQIGILLLCAVLFGIIARSLTSDKRTIYKKNRYFPLIKLILLVLAAIFIKIDTTISLFLLAIFFMVIIWDLTKLKLWKRK